MNMRGLILPIRIIGCFFLCFALTLLGLGGWLYHRSQSFVRQARSTQATVVALTPSQGEPEMSYSPVFEFSDEQGVKHRATSYWSSNPPPYAVGQRVTMLYSPQDPDDARVQGFASLWLWPTIFAASATMPLLVSFALIWLIPFTIRRLWPVPPPLPSRY